jgi:hypothetical protein
LPRPNFFPQTREFSLSQEDIVQRPEGLDSNGAIGVKPEDARTGRVEKYADIQVSPGKFEDVSVYPINPQSNFGGEVVLWEKDLGFPANSLLIDNWTNQWLYEPNLRRFIPPYSGGWVFSSPKGFQKLRILAKAPSASYAPAAAIAGEFAWVGWHESFLTPQTGIIDRAKTPVVV